MDYRTLKKRIADLYDFRSSATHEGLHRHVSQRDVADLKDVRMRLKCTGTIRGRHTDRYARGSAATDCSRVWHHYVQGCVLRDPCIGRSATGEMTAR